VSEPFRYKAFLSYSHLDGKWGAWLHKALESYRVPKRLVGVPARLFPIFRDQEELASSSDLSAEIEKALAQSEFLIVICSPHAAKSEWVNQEVSSFKRMGREHRIRALIVDGDPNARDPVAPGEPQPCFPPALTHECHEPVAADVRRGRDSRNIALLRLIAPLLGVGFDELRQREAEAARRRLLVRRSIAAAFVVLLVVAAVVGWIAIRRANEARQKAEEASRERRGKQFETLRVTSGDVVRLARQGDGTEALRKMLGALDSNVDAARSSLPPEALASLAQALRASQFTYVLRDPSLSFLGARYSSDERMVVTRSTRFDEGGFGVIYDGRTGNKLHELKADMVGLKDTITWPSSSQSGVVAFFQPFGRDSVAAFSASGEPAATPFAALPLERVLDDGHSRAILVMRDGKYARLTKSGGIVAPIRVAARQRVIAADADQDRLIVVDGRTISVIDPSTGKAIAGPWPFDGEIRRAALSRAGDQAAAVFKVGGNYRGLIFSFDGAAPPRELALMPNQQFDRVMRDPLADDLPADIAFADDGKSVVVLWNFGEVWRWNLDGGLVGRVPSPFATSGDASSLSPRGTWVLQAGRAWRTNSGIPDHLFRMPPASQPVAGRAGCPLPDGTQTTYTICPVRTDRVYRIDYASLVLPGEGTFNVFRRSAPGDQTRIAVTPDGRFVPATRNCDNRYRCQLVLLDLVRGQVAAHRDQVRADVAAVTDDGRFVAAFEDARGFIWDTSTNRISPVFGHDASIVSGIRTIVTDAFFIGTDRLMTSGTDGTIRLWAVPDAYELTRDSGDDYAHWLLPTADGRYVVAGYASFGSEHPGLRPIDVLPSPGSFVGMAREAVRREEHTPGRCTGLPLRDDREGAFQEAEIDAAIDRLGIDELDRDLLYFRICTGQVDRVAKDYPTLPRDGLERLRDALQNRPR
jgi:WD40 repeat protein